MTGLKTDPKLITALRKAAGKTLSKETLHQQKVSFIFGSLGKDSTITRAKIEQELQKLEGSAA